MTLPHLISKFKDRPAQLTAVKFKRSSGWVSWSWSEYQDHIESTFWLLKTCGLKPGDRIAIMAPNCVEWALVDLASQCLGAVTIPIYANCSEADFKQILSESEPQAIFLAQEKQVALLPKSLQSSAVIFSGPGKSSAEGLQFFWPLLNENAAQKSFPTDEFIKSCEKVRISDLATIVFTSGTSGKPKGICLTHRQIISELKDVSTAFPITSQDVTLSFLPYAHILGRVEMWLGSYAGFTLAFSESIEAIKKNLLEIKPTVLIAVPRIFEKIYGGVLSKLNSNALQRIIQQFENKSLLHSLALAPARLLLDRKVKESLKEALGGRLKYAISGGAPLAKDVADFFLKCDVLLLEGYGLTETTGAVCVNTPDAHHFGTVGKPLPDVKVKLAPEDQEILLKSDKVFSHFLTSEDNPIDSQGYYHTGDIGEWTPDGFLRITDRKKDLIKTSGGKYVAPQRLENLFKKHPLISQVLIHGDQRKYIVALVTLEPTELRHWANDQKIPFSKTSDLVHSPHTVKQVEKIVKEVNMELASFESIKKFHIMEREFTVESGELTPSLKVRRKFCEEKYKDLIDGLYSI